MRVPVLSRRCSRIRHLMNRMELHSVRFSFVQLFATIRDAPRSPIPGMAKLPFCHYIRVKICLNACDTPCAVTPDYDVAH